MSILEFLPKHEIEPLFGIKLCHSLHKISDYIEEEKFEYMVKHALGIDSKRLIKLKKVEDANGETGTVIILYDYIYKTNKPKVSIPQNEKGYFDFKIYELNFNQEINIEKLIKQLKMY